MRAGLTSKQDMSLFIPQAASCVLRRVLGCKRPGGSARGLIHFQSPQLIPCPDRPSEGKQERE